MQFKFVIVIVPAVSPVVRSSVTVLPQLDESPVKLDPDDFLLSQRSEHDFEVGWNSSSPRLTHAPGVDITDVIRKHATKKQVDYTEGKKCAKFKVAFSFSVHNHN